MAVATGTAMLIGTAASVIGGAISGRAKAKAEAKKADRDYVRQSALSAQDSEQSMLERQFESDLDYANTQRDRAAKQRGLDQFRQFNTIAPFSTQRIVVPTAPDPEQYKTKAEGA